MSNKTNVCQKSDRSYFVRNQFYSQKEADAAAVTISPNRRHAVRIDRRITRELWLALGIVTKVRIDRTWHGNPIKTLYWLQFDEPQMSVSTRMTGVWLELGMLTP